MNYRLLCSQQRMGGMVVALMISLIGAAAPAVARPFFGAPLRMAQAASIAGSWRLVTMGDPSSPGVVPQATALTADFAEDRVTGSGGCNRFMGGYKTQDGQLSIGPLASTFKACEPTIMNQETRYLQALQGAQRYEIDGQRQLSIFYQTEQESGVLRFTTEPVQGLW